MGFHWPSMGWRIHGVVHQMSQLSVMELPEQERADVAKARALLDPYLQIASVEWMPQPKEPNA